VRDASGSSGKFAGRQADARLRYWLVPASLRAGLNAVWLATAASSRRAPAAGHGR